MARGKSLNTNLVGKSVKFVVSPHPGTQHLIVGRRGEVVYAYLDDGNKPTFGVKLYGSIRPEDHERDKGGQYIGYHQGLNEGVIIEDVEPRHVTVEFS
jgi:hypothetical protein